jgi:ATP-binding cassette, subfamily B, bacterial PglK
MTDILLYCHKLLAENDIKIYLIVLFAQLITSILQLLGIFSLFPLMTVLINPEALIENIYFQKYFFLKYQNLDELKLYISGIFLLLNLASIFGGLINSVVLSWLTEKITLGVRLNFYKKILNKKLNFILAIDKDELINVAGSEIYKINTYLGSYLNLIGNLFSVILFFILFVLLDIKVFIAFMILVFLYVLMYLLSKKLLEVNSEKEAIYTRKFSRISLSLNFGFKEIALLNLGKKIIEDFKSISKKYMIIQLVRTLIISYPRYLFEFILIVFVIIYLNSIDTKEIIFSNLPILCVLALAIWRLIPLIFNMYRNFSIITANISSYRNLTKVFSDFFHSVSQKDKIQKNIFKKLKFSKLEIKNVQFSYGENLANFNFNEKIFKHERVLISGDSGSGKTTFMNIISGLIQQNYGYVLINNKQINLDIEGFYKIIGYVSQRTFLFSGPLIENIIFKNKMSVNENIKLKKIYDICGLNNICKNYKEIFFKKIKIDAPELSGGQRQRISLARTLFREPQLLLMDEALNALDRKSEVKIFKKIKFYYPKITIVAASHRPINNFFTRKIKLN